MDGWTDRQRDRQQLTGSHDRGLAGKPEVRRAAWREGLEGARGSPSPWGSLAVALQDLPSPPTESGPPGFSGVLCFT